MKCALFPITISQKYQFILNLYPMKYFVDVFLVIPYIKTPLTSMIIYGDIVKIVQYNLVYMLFCQFYQKE
jgi:hypothetical protein